MNNSDEGIRAVWNARAIWRYISENSNMHSHRPVNFKSQF